jgi:hypothetical protein
MVPKLVWNASNAERGIEYKWMQLACPRLICSGFAGFQPIFGGLMI